MTTFKVGDIVRLSSKEVEKRGLSSANLLGDVTMAAPHPAGGQMLFVKWGITGEGFRIAESSDCPLDIL